MSDRLLDMQPDQSAQAPLKPMRHTKRFNDLPAREQMAFAPRCTNEFVPADAPVRAIDQIMDQLDYAAFEERYRGGGRPAWPPKLMCKLLLLGYSQGIRSAREISRRLDRDLHFMWLAHEHHIDHQRLSEFRRNFADQLRELFTQTVRLALEMGMTTLELVAIDGSKIAANARRRTLNAEELQQAIDKVLAEAEEIDAAEDAEHGAARGDELPEELADPEQRLAELQAAQERLEAAQQALEESGQKRVSVTDPEAPTQKIGGDKRPGWNAQIGVDRQSGVIAAQDVTGDQKDNEQFGPLAEQTLENTGFKPQVTVADRGYESGDNLEDADELGLNAFISLQSRPDSERFEQDDFEYDAEADEFVCPEGKHLTFRREHKRRGQIQRVYATSACDCRDCPSRACCLSAKGKRRELYISPHAELTRRMRERVETEEGQEALRRRGSTVEPVFGIIKSVLGLRQFLLRGLSGARVELTLCATALNLRKLAVAW